MSFEFIKKFVEKQPSVTPKQKMGHWIKEVDFGNFPHYICSECRKEGRDTNFCPNCGADMREGNE